MWERVPSPSPSPPSASLTVSSSPLIGRSPDSFAARANSIAP